MDEQLKRFLPIRIVLREHPDGYEGLIEHSFSMGWSRDRVLIFWSGKAYSNFGTTHELNAIEDVAHHCKDSAEMIIDPLAEDSPIQIDWDRWLAATGKFDKRNAHFKEI